MNVECLVFMMFVVIFLILWLYVKIGIWLMKNMPSEPTDAERELYGTKYRVQGTGYRVQGKTEN